MSSATSGLRWRSAILEGAAVLLGILAAFSIDAWWGVRAERQALAASLAALETELEANRSQVQEDLDSLASWIDQSRWYLEHVAAPGANPTYDEVLEMAWETDPRSTTALATAALDDLTSSGGFQLIPSVEVRRALLAYQKALEDDAVEQEVNRDLFNQTIRTYHMLEGSFSEFPWEQVVEVEPSGASFPFPVRAFAGNRTYANFLIVRMLRFANLRSRHRVLESRIEVALGLIDSAF